MIDEDLHPLGEAGLDHALDGLEADIWRRLAARSRNRAAARRRFSLQSIVMIVGLVGSIAIGIKASRPSTSTHSRAVLALGLELAPSSLLLGHDP